MPAIAFAAALVLIAVAVSSLVLLISSLITVAVFEIFHRRKW